MLRDNLRVLVLLSSVLLASVTAYGQSTAFTYQGKLTDSGNLANGQYDFQLKLFDALSGGAQQGTTQAATNVTVTNAIFTVQIDFGACPTCFNGAARFLEIAVRPGGGGAFTTLTPRQQITATPYALKSQNAGTADGLSVACVLCVTSSQIATVSGSVVIGTIPVASVPAGSGNYIQNQNAVAQSGNFNISGDGTAGGTLSASVVKATTQYNIGTQRVLSAAGSNNLFAGINAGIANTTGADNAFFGSQAGQASTGFSNAFFGSHAGQANTIGGSNAFFGSNAGQANTTGSHNAFFGFHAGDSNTTGDINSFFGEAAGAFNTTGRQNSFFGWQAGIENTTGNRNSFFGQSAGSSNTTGIQNTFIGIFADFPNIPNPTGDSNTLLGYSTNVNSGVSNGTAIGANASVTQSNSLILGSINGVNQATADTKVGIGTTTPGAVLDVQRDGNTIPETARFTTYGSANEILSRASGGTRAAPTATPSGRTLLQLGATGHDTTGFVSSPGASIMMDAAQDWTDTANGTQMRIRTTANDTTAIATRMIITNDGNVGIATTAPVSRFDVVNNGTQIHFSNSPADSGGYLSSVVSSQALLAGGAKFDGTLWIAKSSSASLLDNVSGTIRFFTDSGLTPGSTFSPTEQMRITSAGNVGIGVTAPADKLQVAGDIRVGTGLNGCVKDANGTIIAGTCSSDARLKRAITPFPHLLDELVQLQPVHFYWRSEEFKDRHFGVKSSFGLIAQEVEKVLPELVSEDKQGYKAVNYSKLPLLSLQAIKELKAENDTLKHQLHEQQQQISGQQLEMAAIKKLLCAAQPQADLCKAKSLK